jgi:hypothetical protein
MDATLYTGDGTTGRLIPNTDQGTTGFKPDLVWIKSRSNALNNNWYDSNRGAPNEISSNTTSGDTSGDLTAFNTTGFTINQTASYEINHSGYTYVAWNWQANQGTNVSNTSGTITSSVSANTTAGFSIVTYTGNGSAGATVGHGLGAVPQLIFVKGRTNALNWTVYSASAGATNYLELNTNASSQAQSSYNMFNSTAPTSSVFTLGNIGNTNGSGVTYVAYCWTPIAGYSAFGSYVGTGSATDGAFVYTGFRPRFLMIKGSSGLTNATSWVVYDTARNPANVTDLYLIANTTQGEGTDLYSTVDILSNGFKNRSLGTYGINQSGATYIYMAFAENPFKYANAR